MLVLVSEVIAGLLLPPLPQRGRPVMGDPPPGALPTNVTTLWVSSEFSLVVLSVTEVFAGGAGGVDANRPRPADQRPQT
jgi:hypothetical protein